MKAFIRKNKFGFQYRIEGNTGFNYFPDDVKLTPEGMKAYFQRGGRDEPDLVFCNQAGIPAVHYKIVKGKTFAGQKYAIVDHDEKKIFLFDANEICTAEEKITFLKDHSTRQQDLEADKIEDLNERINFYLSNCVEETKKEFKQMIEEKITPKVLKELCEVNAAGYDPSLPAEVEFVGNLQNGE